MTLIAADRKLSLDEYVLQAISQRLLADDNERAEPIKFKHLDPVLPDCAVILSLLSHAGHESHQDVQQAFSAGMSKLGVSGANVLALELCGIKEMRYALKRARSLVPLQRYKVVDACVVTALYDQKTTVRELELLRAVSTVLDCPMPPILGTSKSEPGEKD